jgi:hypothetical protein
MQGGFAAPNDIGSESVAGLAKADRFVRGYCEPEYEPVLECPQPHPVDLDIDFHVKVCVAVSIVVFIIGYLVGKASAPPCPDMKVIRIRIEAAFDAKIAEARSRGETVAELMLQMLKAEVLKILSG